MGGHESRDASAPIAVIGMSLRVPGANTPARFWRNLVEGRDSLSRPSIAALRRLGVPQDLIANPDFVRALPTLADADRFDAAFFDLSTSEAEVTEPSHRLFLECAWEALESAGIVPGRGAPVTGVFGGCEGNYREKVLASVEDPMSGFNLPMRIGNALDFLTTRVSHRLDLTGPSIAVMAACATSLMAITLAVQSLRAATARSRSRAARRCCCRRWAATWPASKACCRRRAACARSTRRRRHDLRRRRRRRRAAPLADALARATRSTR
jgi:acyl transferase domain-containing protein